MTRRMARSIAIAVLAVLCPSGCIIPGTPRTTLSDLALVSVETVAGRSDVDRMSGYARTEPQMILEVYFSTNTDLMRFAEAHDRSISVSFWPCRTGRTLRYLGFDPKVYGTRGLVDSAAVQAKEAKGTYEHAFHFYVPVAVEDKTEPRNAYDLRATPEDMCFTLWGGSTNLMGGPIFDFSTNTVVISQAAIREAVGAPSAKAQ